MARQFDDQNRPQRGQQGHADDIGRHQHSQGSDDDFQRPQGGQQQAYSSGHRSPSGAPSNDWRGGSAQRDTGWGDDPRYRGQGGYGGPARAGSGLRDDDWGSQDAYGNGPGGSGGFGGYQGGPAGPQGDWGRSRGWSSPGGHGGSQGGYGGYGNTGGAGRFGADSLAHEGVYGQGRTPSGRDRFRGDEDPGWHGAWGGSSAQTGGYGHGSARHGMGGGDRGQDQPFDPDYHQWREEQLRRLDDDYRSWRQDRYKKFSDEFSTWRAGRGTEPGAAQGSGTGGTSASSSTAADEVKGASKSHK